VFNISFDKGPVMTGQPAASNVEEYFLTFFSDFRTSPPHSNLGRVRRFRTTTQQSPIG